jgi:hypothetical protein
MKTMRHSADRYNSLSLAAIIGFYAGTTTAIYGWYPGRYEVKDGLRMGKYALLAFIKASMGR